jgi:hypothetical protein
LKILLLDIETAPNLVHVWGLWNQNVGINQIMDSGYVMCWAAKWYGSDEIIFDSIFHSGTKAMLRRIYKLLDQADAVIHYNGTKFDIPTLNKEFVINGMKPPTPYKQIDLLRTARGQFRFPSNKLDYIAQTLGIGAKTVHRGHQLWIDCMAKKPEAWEEMEVYNRNDVVILEGVYEILKPWIRNHPNQGLYGEDPAVCPNCGGSHLHRRGVARTRACVYQRFQCTDCGTWSRTTKEAVKRPAAGYISV